MMSQQRLGPFEMHTKTVTARSTLGSIQQGALSSVYFVKFTASNYNNLCDCCFCIQVTSTTVGSSSAGNRTDIPRYTEPAQVNVKLTAIILKPGGHFK